MADSPVPSVNALRLGLALPFATLSVAWAGWKRSPVWRAKSWETNK